MSNATSKTGLFLMELILSILFFSLAGAVCVQMFVHSHIINKNSVELNHAVEWCQNVAEAFYGCDGNQEQLLSLFDNCYPHPASEASENTWVLLFNEEFQPTNNINCSYYVSIEFTQQGSFMVCDTRAFHCISGESSSEFLSDEKPIYELTNTYFPGEEASYE